MSKEYSSLRATYGDVTLITPDNICEYDMSNRYVFKLDGITTNVIYYTASNTDYIYRYRSLDGIAHYSSDDYFLAHSSRADRIIGVANPLLMEVVRGNENGY